MIQHSFPTRRSSDLEAEKRAVDIGMVEYIHVRKTGALIRAAIRLGAQVAGASAADLRRVTRFGDCLGLAFQIADDILDFHGEDAAGASSESGHNEKRKATYPSVVGIVQARERLNELLQLCLQELASFGARAAPLQAIARHVVTRAIRSNSEKSPKESNA